MGNIRLEVRNYSGCALNYYFSESVQGVVSPNNSMNCISVLLSVDEGVIYFWTDSACSDDNGVFSFAYDTGNSQPVDGYAASSIYPGYNCGDDCTFAWMNTGDQDGLREIVAFNPNVCVKDGGWCPDLDDPDQACRPI